MAGSAAYITGPAETLRKLRSPVVRQCPLTVACSALGVKASHSWSGLPFAVASMVSFSAGPWVALKHGFRDLLSSGGRQVAALPTPIGNRKEKTLGQLYCRSPGALLARWAHRMPSLRNGE